MAKKLSVQKAACPTRELLDLVGDKWSTRVIFVLHDYSNSRRRFSELQKDISGISQRMLTTTLRRLERDGMIKRYSYAEIPPRVEYELTRLGEDLAIPMQQLKAWVEAHAVDICQARDKFDQRNERQS